MKYYYSKISSDKIKKASKFKYPDDLKRTVYGEILCRYLACHTLGITNKEIVLDKNKYGKPYIKNHDNFCYNISHSGDWVVCGVSKYDIGVDIEKIDSVDINIANRFFTKKESQYLMKLAEEEQKHAFYALWTLKESYIKYCGKGLSMPLYSFDFYKKEVGYCLAIEGENVLCNHISFDKKYYLAACYRKSKLNPRVQIIDINNIVIH